MADTGTAKSPYNSVTTETISGEIAAAPHNTNVSNLKSAVEGHVHDLTAGCVDDDELANLRWRSVDASDKWVMVSGTKSVTMTNGAGEAALSFAADAEQGDPSFSATPQIVIVGEYPSAGISQFTHPSVINVRAPSPTATTIVATQLDGGSDSGTLTVHWIAVGKTD